jgi:Asp-tRNA(Asn)/Glu-tRNA(Gln) amidotransferase A subunit family amidase
MTDPFRFAAAEAATAIADGRLSSEELVRSCLGRIAERDPLVRAWAYVDPLLALGQARERDRDRRTPWGPLHGVPVGVKDMIDTADMPTQHNSPIWVGRRPAQDASVVRLLRAAGAVVLGKTETHEFAAGGRLPVTRNPHDPACTAGGSSSGSGAAVGDFHVPLALGTQTAGSTLRPASFCGVFAMKPTWNTVSFEGAKHYSVSLDTIGWYGRSVADLALLAEALGALLERPAAPPRAGALRIALCRTPMWEKAEPASQAAVETAADRLRRAGAAVEELVLPPHFARLWEAQATIMRAEGRATFLADYKQNYAKLHQDFRNRVENADRFTPQQIAEALDLAAACRPEWDAIAGRYDAVLAPSAIGEAPRSLDTTGNPMFQRMWTALHAPSINIPGFKGPRGLPIGVTLGGPRYSDARLLAVAETVAGAIEAKIGV